MGKIGCWNKKRAVLAIFYCGCKQSKSFHIPPPDRREDKGTHFFRNRKIRPRFSAKTGIRRNGSSPRFRRRAPASGPAMKRHLPTAPGFAERKSHRGSGGFHHSYRGAPKLPPQHLLHFGCHGLAVVTELLVEDLEGGRITEMVQTVDRPRIAHEAPQVHLEP